MPKKNDSVRQTKNNHFVDKQKFYEHLNTRYENLVLPVKNRQKKYYRMIQKAEGDDLLKNHPSCC